MKTYIDGLQDINIGDEALGQLAGQHPVLQKAPNIVRMRIA